MATQAWAGFHNYHGRVVSHSFWLEMWDFVPHLTDSVSEWSELSVSLWFMIPTEVCSRRSSSLPWLKCWSLSFTTWTLDICSTQFRGYLLMPSDLSTTSDSPLFSIGGNQTKTMVLIIAITPRKIDHVLNPQIRPKRVQNRRSFGIWPSPKGTTQSLFEHQRSKWRHVTEHLCGTR